MQVRQGAFLSKLPHRLSAGLLLAVFAGVLQAGSVTYTYDSLGRVTKATYANGVVITYVYDAAGNRTSYTVTGAPI
jgi:YD repeat-containing protein